MFKPSQLKDMAKTAVDVASFPPFAFFFILTNKCQSQRNATGLSRFCNFLTGIPVAGCWLLVDYSTSWPLAMSCRSESFCNSCVLANKPLISNKKLALVFVLLLLFTYTSSGLVGHF